MVAGCRRTVLCARAARAHSSPAFRTARAGDRAGLYLSGVAGAIVVGYETPSADRILQFAYACLGAGARRLACVRGTSRMEATFADVPSVRDLVRWARLACVCHLRDGCVHAFSRACCFGARAGNRIAHRISRQLDQPSVAWTAAAGRYRAHFVFVVPVALADRELRSGGKGR